MVTKIRLTTPNELSEFVHLAALSDYDIGVYASDTERADGKSIVGLLALEFDRPLLVVTDDEHFLKKIHKWSLDA